MEPPPPVVVDLTPEVTSTVNNGDAPKTETDNNSRKLGVSEKRRSDVIQSSCISQSTGSAGEIDINAHENVCTRTSYGSQRTNTQQSVSGSAENDSMATPSTLSSKSSITAMQIDRQCTQKKTSNNKSSGTDSTGDTVIIKRNKIESKAKQYLKELQDSETDEQAENVKRLAELECTLNGNEKVLS